MYCIYYQLLGNCSKGGELFHDTSKKYRFRVLEPCTAQCFMKVKADAPLSNFYKVYRFDSILNDSFSARCRIVCSIFLMVHNPAVGNPQSFCYFLGRIPAGKRQCGQKTTYSGKGDYLFLITFCHISLLL